MKHIILPAMLLLIPTAAFAADAPAGSSSADATKAAPRKVCREEIRTGTKFKSRLCKTQEEWDAEADAAQKKMGDWSRGSGSRYSGGTDGGGGARSGVGIGGM